MCFAVCFGLVLVSLAGLVCTLALGVVGLHCSLCSRCIICWVCVRGDYVGFCFFIGFILPFEELHGC